MLGVQDYTRSGELWTDLAVIYVILSTFQT